MTGSITATKKTTSLFFLGAPQWSYDSLLAPQQDAFYVRALGHKSTPPQSDPVLSARKKTRESILLPTNTTGPSGTANYAL